MNKYKYSIETVDQVRNDIEPLLVKHYEEVSVVTDIIKLNPDWDAYYRMENAHMLRIYTAREQETNHLKGYFVVIQAPSLHYKDDIFVVNDVIYVDKSIRGSIVGPRLIKFAEKDLEALGVSVLTINTKTHLPFDGLLEKLGYSCQEKVYAKNFKRKRQES